MKVETYQILANPQLFFGWPANHGSWQWGNEFLFGIAMGPRDENAVGMHKVGALSKVQVRSNDGGYSWVTYFPDVDFEGVDPTPCIAVDENSILRFCGIYDHGGEMADERGSFYQSTDRGYTWGGPFLIDNVDLTDGGHICTTRTCYTKDLVFLSKARKGRFGSDKVVVAMRTKHSEFPFIELSTLPPSEARQVMPAVATLDDGTIVLICRRRIKSHCFISSYSSPDLGRTWRLLNVELANTGERNGNPPALIRRGRALIAAYGNRSTGKMMFAISTDGGRFWDEYVMKDGGWKDFGYPQLFAREDSAIVCVYYAEGVIECALIRDL